MNSDKPAALVHLVSVRGPATFEGAPEGRLFVAATGAREDAVDGVLDYLGRPDGCTAELATSRLSEGEVRLMNLKAGEIRDLSQGYL